VNTNDEKEGKFGPNPRFPQPGRISPTFSEGHFHGGQVVFDHALTSAATVEISRFPGHGFQGPAICPEATKGSA